MVEPSSLQKYSLFGGLLEEQIDKILPLLEQETYEGGADIIVEGAPCDKIRFILEGRTVAVLVGITLAEFKEGDTFGEMEVLEVMPTAATVTTISPTRVMSISNRALRSIYKQDVKVFSLMLMNLARDLSRRLRSVDDRISNGKIKIVE
jgi:CRP-like cAMP-binding protein